jgi:hypothetical protein
MRDEKPTRKDRIVLLGPVGPDRSFPALRLSADKSVVGIMTPVVDGQSLGEQDVLSLEPLSGTGVYEATVLYEGRPSPHAGPAMVNSREFRSGWDAVFGGAPSKRVVAN